MRHHWHRWLLAIPLVLGLTVLACNDDSNNTPTAPRVPSATDTPTPAPTAAPPAMTPTPSGSQNGEVIGFIGTLNAINGSTLTVGTRTVVTNDSTEFRRNGNLSTLSEFSIGEDVRVRGQVLGDGSIRGIRVAFPIS
jgi:hypothetical protein